MILKYAGTTAFTTGKPGKIGQICPGDSRHFGPNYSHLNLDMVNTKPTLQFEMMTPAEKSEETCGRD
jgi:hypothetical protein